MLTLFLTLSSSVAPAPYALRLLASLEIRSLTWELMLACKQLRLLTRWGRNWLTFLHHSIAIKCNAILYHGKQSNSSVFTSFCSRLLFPNFYTCSWQILHWPACHLCHQRWHAAGHARECGRVPHTRDSSRGKEINWHHREIFQVRFSAHLFTDDSPSASVSHFLLLDVS